MSVGRCIGAGAVTAAAAFLPAAAAVAIGGNGAPFFLTSLLLLAAVVGPWWGASLARRYLGQGNSNFPRRGLVFGCWIGLVAAANPNWHVVSLPHRAEDATIGGLAAFVAFLWLGAALGAALGALVATHVVIGHRKP